MQFRILNLCFLVTAIAVWSCEPKQNEKQSMNPLLQEFNTPFGVPPFEKIHNQHFEPAINEAMKVHEEEVAAIVNSKEEPTFSNTIEALESAGELLTRVSRVFYALNSAHTNDSIQQIARDMAPEMSRHSDDITLNAALFERVKSVWDQKESLDLNPEQARLLEKTYKQFVRSGANLSEEKKDQLKAINGEISTLTVQFGQNVLAETNAYQLVVDNEADLSGLPEGLISAAKSAAEKEEMEGKWVFTLANSSVMPFLQYADNRELRRQIWEAYMKRGDNGNEFDNKEILRKLANLRAERAQLLGYETHAHYVLEESMAKTPENVYNLLNQLWEPALEVAKVEAYDIQEMIKNEGHSFEAAPYDWRYYAEKIRQERFDLDEEQLRPYFSLDGVRDGVFMVTQKLWGVTLKEIKDIPRYHEEVTVYEVLDNDGSHLGVIYMDFFPRASKRGGAWMTSFRSQKMEDGKRVAPIVSIVCNFTKPTGDKPALLTLDEVTTYFHEFGHALHGLLSQVNYGSLAGTSVPRDFVELPSQVMENWAEDPLVLKMYAKNYQTGETIPDALIEKIKRSGTFGQGFATTEYLAASLLDLHYHARTEPLEGDVNAFEKKSMEAVGLIDEIIPRYRSTYFNHVFAGGYSSGYYSYIWSGVLDSDAYQAFKETDLFDQATAQSFRKNILERGGTQEPMELYVNFRGREPDIEPLLKKRGLQRVPVDRKL